MGKSNTAPQNSQLSQEVPVCAIFSNTCYGTLIEYKKPTQNTQSQQDAKDASPVYLQVRREWLEDRKVSTGGQIVSGSAMQRWQQEAVRDQPYNNIGAVTGQDVRRS
ncbi:hypothetical protein G7Y89_g12276 [Cudoniella acicularis]|uniref:Uncharacterized protein n=1 Tax=Cudoniella acicularis TaxID=354080 RepID=A0A8H4RBQ0_9HELO|nr:hypothetical protein G7Y89_g12276 [Cudoniella acicularis]